MTNEEIQKVKNGVVFVPTAGRPVAVVYNIPGVSNLKLSRKVLPAIFSRSKSRAWCSNSSQIVTLSYKLGLSEL